MHLRIITQKKRFGNPKRFLLNIFCTAYNTALQASNNLGAFAFEASKATAFSRTSTAAEKSTLGDLDALSALKKKMEGEGN